MQHIARQYIRLGYVVIFCMLFKDLVPLTKHTWSLIWWKFDQSTLVELFSTHAHALISPLSCWPCPWQPRSSGKACVSGCTRVLSISSNHTETLPSLFLSPAHLLLSLPHSALSLCPSPRSSQEALCWSCGPCTYRPALSLTRGSQHTHFIQFLHVPIAAAATVAALDRLHIRPSTFSSFDSGMAYWLIDLLISDFFLW